MFSVQQIGPLALREMALRSGSAKEICENIDQLKSSEIQLGSSVYSRAVEKLASDGRDELLHGLLHSDQHPDVLEDKKLQKKLLHDFLIRKRWDDAHRTLVILTLFHKNAKNEYWNELFQHSIQAKNFQKMQELADDMYMIGVPISRANLDNLSTHFFRPRRQGHPPDTQPFYHDLDDLTITTNIFLRQLRMTGEIYTQFWREIIKRHGMLGNFERLARLCHHLVHAYGPIAKGNSPNFYVADTGKDPALLQKIRSLPAADVAHPIRKLFFPLQLQCLVAWGFQHGTRLLYAHKPLQHYYHNERRLQSGRQSPRTFWPSAVRPPPPESTFLRGLILVQKLAEMGVEVEVSPITEILRERLWVLYGPGMSARKINKRGLMLNPYSLEELIDAINRTWKGPRLFPEFDNIMPTKHRATVQPPGDGRSSAARERLSECTVPTHIASRCIIRIIH